MITGDAALGTRRRRRQGGLKRSDKIQLLIVDEHPLLRASVKTLLENDGEVEVVAEADSVEEGVVACRRHQPDVILMDLDESTIATVDGMRRLREEVPGGALVVLSRHEDDEEVFRAVVGGAAGHVANDADPAELVDTIRQAATGNEPIAQTLRRRPNVGRRVLEAFAALTGRASAARPPSPHLSPRDLRILTYAARGMTNLQIGHELGVSEHTVKAAISQILAQLGLRHRTEAVVHAIGQGWITPAESEPREPVSPPRSRPGSTS